MIGEEEGICVCGECVDLEEEMGNGNEGSHHIYIKHGECQMVPFPWSQAGMTHMPVVMNETIIHPE